jgi:hypothetical protein
MGLLAADQLIVPCTADSASIRSIFNILRLIYGIKDEYNSLDDVVFDTFNTKVKEAGYMFPKIHSFIVNKARTMNRNVSVAYQFYVDEIKRIVKEFENKYPDIFVEAIDRTLELKDCNILALILNFTSSLPSKL